jgi:DNA-directed RNA polymerase subunit M
MRPVNGVMTCPKCGQAKGAGANASLLVKSKAQERETVVVDVQKDKVDALPTATYFCEKCGHDTAYYYFRQTRAADEATTRFLECVKCGYKWREYR